MRPIALDLHGFASFREEARVDFSDAEFFALIGPTGSGKSTVIDAMTFALYGSVPRWGRKGMVSMAMAPTVARGTVKLVFEVDRQRYVVARELRRVGGTVSQRAASLERLADPRGLAAPGDQTFPMAKDLDGVNEAVEALIGLKYEDFTQCVVLPQGQFAAFLHAKPAERQEILLRLLGAEHYRAMMAKANARAAVAAQRAGTYAEELLGYADATPEAEKAAQAAQAGLAALGERVAAALPLIEASRSELAAADARLGQARAEQQALTALRVPDGAGRLDAGLAASGDARRAQQDAERHAEQADRAARDALAAGPQRGPLERAQERRAERARHQADIPGLAEGVTRLGERAAQATAAADAAAAAVESARAGREAAARAAADAAARVAGLDAEHARLAAVTVPGGITELDQRRAAAVRAVSSATAALDEAEQADAAAREALTAAAPEAPLAQAARDLGDLRTLARDTAGVERAAAVTRTAATAAEAAVADAEQAQRRRRAELEEARRAHVVAGLRPHLVPGEPCPVCEQAVTTLPAPLPADEVDDAAAQLAAADDAVAAARAAARKADTAAVTATAGLTAAATRRTTLAAGLAGLLDGPLATFELPAARTVTAAFAGPDSAPDQGQELLAAALAEVAALDQARQGAGQAARRSATAAREAGTRHRAALTQATATEEELNAARSALRGARDPLVELGAPPADGTSLADGWSALARWAGEQAAQRAAGLTEARQARAACDAQLAQAVAAFSDADRALAGRRAEARDASDQDQQARARLSSVTGRVAELDTALADAPGTEEITRQLARLTELETAAAGAEARLRSARDGRAAAEAAHAALEADERAARAAYSAARDRVVALGAPAPGDQGLLSDWTELVSWASGQARAREELAAAATSEAGAARAAIAGLAGQLSQDLAGASIDLAPDAVAASAAPAVSAALASAQAVARRAAERRAQATDLAAKQRDAAEQQQVAHLLGNLLQARQFPQWLVSEALDDLVLAASRNLAALSSGQFDLTHDKGDLFVIDHADADARRSVRTLSGGETFQASLALALALSSQISALATAGSARLDSIFLDEGFGTLDPETLEVVASTLEALAEGDRMVGVVTHVSALAERVPVRFRVAKSARTSTITREGLPAAETETA